MMIIKILGWLALIAGNVHLDAWLIKRSKSINHPIELILRAMAGIVYGGAIFDAQVDTGGRIMLFEAATYITIFEPWLNLKRGLAWDYLSSSTDAAAWDRFFVKRRWLYYIVKLAALAGAGYSIYKLMSL